MSELDLTNLDRYRDQARAGAGTALSPQLRKLVQSRQIHSYFTGDMWSEPVLDLKWGYGYNSSKAPHTYFDYFFSGQDISVAVEGSTDVNSDTAYASNAMPIMEFAFGIQQQKQPIYGFWSFTHDAVMRGTRIVNGTFRIATTSTNYMIDQIANAASSRARAGGDVSIAGLDVDEQNIEKYWWSERNSSDMAGPNLFSSHPPFNLVIVYGLQTPSLYDSVDTSWEEVYTKYKSDTALMSDVNERVVEAGVDYESRLRIVGCEITGCQVEFSTDGQPCSEVYSFFAKDLIVTPPQSVTKSLQSTSTP